MSEYSELARKICHIVMQKGAHFADVEIVDRRNLHLEVEKNGVHYSRESIEAAVSVRAIINGATGVSRVSGVNIEEAKAAASRAVEIARLAHPDPDFVTLPSPSNYPSIPGLYDEKLARMSAEELISLYLKEVDGALSVQPEALVNGAIRLEISENVLVNSLGVENQSPNTYVGCHIACVVKNGEYVGAFDDYDVARILDDFNPQGLGVRTCTEAMKYRDARSIRNACLPVILGPLATKYLFWAVGLGAGAEKIQRKRSFLSDKKGQRIAPPFLSLRDDAYIPGGISSGACDGEGALRKKVTIIDHGIFVGHLHSTYTAHKAKEDNTGHGSRFGGTYPTNIVPNLGDITEAEMIADTQEGIYVNSCFLFPNMVTGDISATIDYGYKIEKGVLVYPLKNTMMGIHILELLQKIDAISSDYREEPGQIMPTVRIQNVKVAGSA